MLESVSADIRKPELMAAAYDRAHQLVPIQKFVTRLKNDVRETGQAVQAVLEDDETLQDLCLSWNVQQRQHTRWMPVELQRHRCAVLCWAVLGWAGSGGQLCKGELDGCDCVLDIQEQGVS